MSISELKPSGLGSREYERLLENVNELTEQNLPCASSIRPLVEEFLFYEAQLLDSGKLEEWHDLFTPDSVYWIPSNPEVGDPRREVGLAFDDNRRLADRIFWLRTNLAYCQIPQSRTRHLITNVWPSRSAHDDTIVVRSNFILTEYREGQMRHFSGWYGHVLAVSGSEPSSLSDIKIRSKIISLIESDEGHDNLTLLF